MALQQLTDEQTRTWTRTQKDEWWLKNIYRGDMAQLTMRSAITGFVLGGVLSATALYIGGKTGISIGVGLTSVILAFAIFRLLTQLKVRIAVAGFLLICGVLAVVTLGAAGKTALSNAVGLGSLILAFVAFRLFARAGVVRDFTILENNCTQSIASAAGYMITPLVSSLAAYMLVTGRIVPWWQMIIWNAVIATLGVLVAFPMKRRFINEDQLPFPEGRACGVVLDTLYTGHASAGMFKARLLGVTAVLSAVYQFITSDGWMKLLQFKLLHLNKWAGLKEPWHLHERFDDYYYALAAKFQWTVPKILGTDFRQLGLRFTLDAAMMGVGGLMGIRVATSCLLGAVINFAVLAPIIIQRGEIKAYAAPSGALVQISRPEIVNQWSLWWGVTMMVVGSLVSLFAKPDLFKGAFKAFRRRAPSGPDVLRHIELPLWISFVGVPIFSVLGAWVTHEFFGVPWLLAFVSLPLIFVLAVICTNSMALTSWMPTGALSKITQFSMGAIDRTNPANNLIPAGMTAEISNNAANLLSDIKPGYMLGAKPRQQAIGHIIGIFAGAIASTPLFFLLFLPPNKEGVRSVSTIISEQFAMPAALQWKGVADLISKGVGNLPTSAVIAMGVAAFAAILFEVLRITTKGRFPISAVSVGLGVVLPPDACFAMWLGALPFWWKARQKPAPGTKVHDFWVDGCEPICAGLISGAAIIGIGNAIVNVLIE